MKHRNKCINIAILSTLSRMLYNQEAIMSKLGIADNGVTNEMANQCLKYSDLLLEGTEND